MAKDQQKLDDNLFESFVVGAGAAAVSFGVEKLLSAMGLGSGAKAILEGLAGVSVPYAVTRFEVAPLTQSVAVGLIGPIGPNLASHYGFRSFRSGHIAASSGKLFGNGSLPSGVTMIDSRDCKKEKY